MPWITHLLALINALLTDRARLAMENGARRQQVIVLQRSVTPDTVIATPHLGGLHHRYDRAAQLASPSIRCAGFGFDSVRLS